MADLKRIIYASSTVSKSQFRKLFENSPKMPGQQAQRYNRLLMQGIAENGIDVACISAPPITRQNTTKKVVSVTNDIEDGIKYNYIKTFNIRLLKNILVMVTAFFKGLKLIKKNSALVCDVLNVSVSLGTIAAAKIKKSQIVGIVTDVPELMVTGHSVGQVKLCYKIISRCDKYVFLTEAMNERLNPSGKPHIVIEGISDGTTSSTTVQKPEGKRKCLYAGLLDAEYGVKNLVEGFILANIPNTELHICGSGPYENELREIINESNNIVFHGTLFNEEVLKLERECDLLINPRPTSGEFTKFSFPSKVMEYMSSGTPVLTTKLPGIPNDYFPHLFIIEDYSKEGIRDAITQAFNMTNNELYIFGAEAQKWVDDYKAYKAQGSKIIEFTTDSI